MRKFKVALLAMVMTLSSAGLVFADVTQNVGQTVGQNVGVSMNPTLNAQLLGTQNQSTTTTSESASKAKASAYSEGGKAKATGGDVDFRYSNQREFLGAPGVYQSNGPGSYDTSRHRWVSHASFVSVHKRLSQKSFDAMIAFLKQAHEMDSETREWEDLRDDLVVQPVVDNPQPPSEFIDMIPAFNFPFENLNADEIVGGIYVRDKKMRENPVEKGYMVFKAYPLAKLAGATVIIKVDDYFRGKLKSGSWGGGIGGALSALLGCFTGSAGSVQFGFNSGNLTEYLAGGELYLLLRPVEKPCPPPEPEVKKPKCDLVQIWKEIHEIEILINDCKKLSMNNLTLREKILKKYIRLYVCTGDARYLDKVIFHFAWAQANYDGGWDISSHRAEADRIIGSAQYLTGGAILIRQGEKVAREHMEKYHLEKIPDGFFRSGN